MANRCVDLAHELCNPVHDAMCAFCALRNVCVVRVNIRASFGQLIRLRIADALDVRQAPCLHSLG